VTATARGEASRPPDSTDSTSGGGTDARPDLGLELGEAFARRRASRVSWLARALALLGVGSLALHGLLVLRWNVNWDEFHYLSYVYEAARGELAYAWATFHVHLFGWLRGVGGTEVDQVLVARGVSLLALAGSALLLYRIALRLFEREAALVVPLAYLTFGYVIHHGASFRPDPYCALLLLFALDRLLPPAGRRSAALGGAAMALAAAITIKAMLHVALVAAALLVLVVASPRTRRRRLESAAWFAGVFCALAPLLMLLHRASVTVTGQGTPTRFLTMAASNVFGTGVLFPRRRVVVEGIEQNPLFWLLLAASVLLCLAALRRRDGARERALLLLLFAAPVASLAVYRNAFQYFYVFMLPTVAIAACGVVDFALRRASARARWIGPAASLVVALGLVSGELATFRRHLADETAVQRQLLAVVHRMFPEPVPYVDRCSMVSSFPKVGFFMSSLGLQRYRETGEPDFGELLRERPVPFLVANTISLRLDLPDRILAGKPYSLRREDIALIRDNFVHHWGLVFVQGKRLDFTERAGPIEFEILAAGPFTLEAEGEVEIDGAPIAPGATVELSAGRHRAVALGGTRGAILRWGERLWRPDFPPLVDPIFLDL